MTNIFPHSSILYLVCFVSCKVFWCFFLIFCIYIQQKSLLRSTCTCSVYFKFYNLLSLISYLVHHRTKAKDLKSAISGRSPRAVAAQAARARAEWLAFLVNLLYCALISLFLCGLLNIIWISLSMRGKTLWLYSWNIWSWLC